MSTRRDRAERRLRLSGYRVEGLDSRELLTVPGTIVVSTTVYGGLGSL